MSTIPPSVSDAHQVLLDGVKLRTDLLPPGAGNIGEYWFFSEAERVQIDEVRNHMMRYLDVETPRSPLCFAVFGSPGSGKTFLVEEIAKDVQVNRKGKLAVRFHELNLSQIESPEQFAATLAQIAQFTIKDEVPLIFIDEFDTARNGVPLGWLSWFLHPMSDGKWRHAGVLHELKRAFYFFAGGTRSTFEAFSMQQGDTFRSAKGPDFLSRLRGYLDVMGVNNHPHRELRRAAVLHVELQKSRTTLGVENGYRLRLEGSLAESMLQGGRFRHGARSIRAILEMSKHAVDKKADYTLQTTDLPKEFLPLHYDHGRLDRRRLGGPIQISAGAVESDQGAYNATWEDVCRTLWTEGATLAYGGRLSFGPGSTQKTLATLAEELAKQIPPPIDGAEARVVVFEPPAIGTGHSSNPGTKGPIVHGVTDEEMRALATDEAGQRLAQSIALSRMRLQVAREAVATVALGGKTQSWSGRCPGVAEEVMLAIAFGKPIYLLGQPGGLVGELGSLLGLDSARPMRTRAAIKAMFHKGIQTKDDPQGVHFLDRLHTHREEFESMAPHPLPVMPDKIVDFLADHGLWSGRWVDNGLSKEDNCRLFSASGEAARALLIRGLTSRLEK